MRIFLSIIKDVGSQLERLNTKRLRECEMFAFICKILGHKWLRNDCIRTCSRCGYEQALWYNEFPKIGETQIEWDDSPDQRLQDSFQEFDRTFLKKN